MHYSEYPPAPELAPWVAAYWSFEVRAEDATFDHWIPPTGGVMLAFPRGAPAVLVGPRTTPFQTRVRSHEPVWGVHFWPGAAVSLLGTGAARQREGRVLAHEVVPWSWLQSTWESFDGAAAAAVSAWLDQQLTPRVGSAGPLDSAVLGAVFRIIAAAGDLEIASLAAPLAISSRQLRRRFRRATELSLKELARVERLRASARGAVDPSRRSWVQIAAEQGYADQAHLVREFRQLLGLTPGAFEEHARRIRHGDVVR